jgi:zinc protease
MQSISPPRGKPGAASGHLLKPLSMFAILGLLMISTAITLAQPPTLQIDQYRLPNGLTVIMHEDHSVPVTAVQLMYHVGSKNEKSKRTGFAHLFEHIMFKGSEHVADGEHFKLLQEIGANINGSTTEDRTNYFEVVPSNYIELALYMESDRMGFLLPALTQAKLDNQRDVVKNERRQNYDNKPYGTASEKISKALFPEGHPYSWPVIGYMEDLSAAALEDVKEFFRVYYAPNNACLVIVGNFDPKQTKEWVDKYFGPIPEGKPIERPHVQNITLKEDKRMIFEDKVQLPRLFMNWPSAPRQTREDAVLDVLTDILSSGKNSRLYKSLVFDTQIAQSVQSAQEGMEIAGMAGIDVTAKPGKSLAEMEKAVDEILAGVMATGVTEKEIQTSLNNKEAQLVRRQATALGLASALATYHTLTGDAQNFNREMDRFKGITPEEVQAAAKKVFNAKKVVLSIVPQGKVDLAAQGTLIVGKEGAK